MPPSQAAILQAHVREGRRIWIVREASESLQVAKWRTRSWLKSLVATHRSTKSNDSLPPERKSLWHTQWISLSQQVQ